MSILRLLNLKKSVRDRKFRFYRIGQKPFQPEFYLSIFPSLFSHVGQRVARKSTEFSGPPLYIVDRLTE